MKGSGVWLTDWRRRQYDIEGPCANLQDIASLPVSHSPEKAFFIVLPLPVDLDASAHVDAITKDLAHMVQRRGMGFAVSYRWLEECFREGRLLSPAAWAVRV